MSTKSAFGFAIGTLLCLSTGACVSVHSVSFAERPSIATNSQGTSISGDSTLPRMAWREAGASSHAAEVCASDGSPCSDPNNPNPKYPVCAKDCCSRQYHDCDGLACICGSGR